MSTVPRIRISPGLISGATISYSLLWFAAAIGFYLTNQRAKDGWSGAPVSVLWALIILPLLLVVLVASLVSSRRAKSQRLRLFDYAAIIAAGAPFAFIGVVFLILAFSR